MACVHHNRIITGSQGGRQIVFRVGIFLFVLVFFAAGCNHAPQGTNSKSSKSAEGKSKLIDTIPQVSKQPDSLDSTHFYPDPIYENDIQKAQISKRDSSFWVISDIKSDYRIFGYEKPDTNSTRLIVFSVFTRDVQNNPYKCSLGAYYGSSFLSNTTIKFRRDAGDFVLAELTIEGKRPVQLFFERKWIEFVE